MIGALVPCFNQGRYVHESVGSLLSQSLPLRRVVVVDDASNDGISPGLCRALASDIVTVVCLKANLGRALVRNRALEELRGMDYVVVLDADDVLDGEYVREIVSRMDERKEVGVGYGRLHPFVDGEPLPNPVTSVKYWPNKSWDIRRKYLENQIPGPGAIFRRQALEMTSGWRRDYTMCSGEDFDIGLQVVNAGFEPMYVESANGFYRQHKESFLASFSDRRWTEMDLAILKNHKGDFVKHHDLRVFLRRRAFSCIRRELRSGKRQWAMRNFAKCLVLAPYITVSDFAGYYLDRVVCGLRRRV